MKIEDQVCTFEQAKRLDKIGEIRLSSAFMWYEALNEKTYELVEPYLNYESTPQKATIVHWSYPAYTVAELGKLLPGSIYTKSGWSGLHQYKTDPYNQQNTEFALIYISNSDPKQTVPSEPVIGRTEAEARANMLLFLLEKHGICPSTINEVK